MQHPVLVKTQPPKAPSIMPAGAEQVIHGKEIKVELYKKALSPGEVEREASPSMQI